MNKKELVDLIAQETGFTKRKVNIALSAMLSTIEDEVGSGGKVTLSNFGVFSIMKRKSRNVRNPGTGIVMRVPSKAVPHFAPGKGLKAAISSDDKALGAVRDMLTDISKNAFNCKRMW